MRPALRPATALLGVLLLAGCVTSSGGGDAADDTTTAPTVTPTASVPKAFLEQTAQHLCAVQGKVYPDAAALADAFETAPEYPGIEASEVRRLSRRLETDTRFARDLNDRISATCG